MDCTRIRVLAAIFFIGISTSLIPYAKAGSATCAPTALSDLYDQSANWNPVTVPNGPDDMATLRTSNMTLDLCASIKVGGNTHQVNTTAATATTSLRPSRRRNR